VELEDSIAIVTGASGGIGLAIARKLSEKGATLVPKMTATDFGANGSSDSSTGIPVWVSAARIIRMIHSISLLYDR